MMARCEGSDVFNVHVMHPSLLNTWENDMRRLPCIAAAALALGVSLRGQRAPQLAVGAQRRGLAPALPPGDRGGLTPLWLSVLASRQES